MIYLFKILPALVMPTVWIIVLILLSVWLQRRLFAWLAVALLLLTTNPYAAHHLMRWVEQDAVRLSTAAQPKADAIVVLSGMLRDVDNDQGGTTPEWGDAVDRFDGGIALYHADKAPTLVFTGGRLPWSTSDITEGQVLRKRALARGVPDSAIYLTGEVQNTQQEARAIGDWLRQTQNAASPHILLVTSAFHMARAKRLFEATGLRVTAFPVDFLSKIEPGDPSNWAPSGHALRKFETAWRECLGQWFYRLRDWLA